MTSVLEFAVDETRYAVPAERVIEVVPRVRVTPLPATSAVIAGAINHRGRAIVVVDLRARFGHALRAPSIADHFVIVRGARRTLALVVDRAVGLRAIDFSMVQEPSPAIAHIAGIVTVEASLLLLEDLDAALSLDEESAAAQALQTLEASG